MTLRLYDTASRGVRDFEPLVEGRVGIYLCGATVQSPPHVGHIRSGLNFDLLRRWLEHRRYAVTFVRNVTDIDDKILAKATEQGVPSWAIAAANERAFTQAYDALGCLPPSVEPRATGHVPEMIGLIHRLIDAGCAYPAGGDVYFDVRSFPSYGALSGQALDAMLPAGDSAGDARKRDPRDFALWKGAKPGEPAWDTPWGKGRPGWHLECSAMAERYLGPTFDIHGGGIDLIFPHHENEIAQSKAAGGQFARYWLHNGWVTAAGEKMSKSLGNSLLVREVIRRVRPVELRYYLGSAHYRSNLEFSEEALGEAATAYARVEGFVQRAAELVGDLDLAGAPLCAGFAEAMDDDLAVPQALAALHDAVREGNKLLADGPSPALAGVYRSVRAMLGVLGLDPLSEPWVGTAALGGSGGNLGRTVDALVAVALQQRQAARERKDFAAADSIRAGLASAGIAVEDTPHGPRWQLAASSVSGS